MVTTSFQGIEGVTDLGTHKYYPYPRLEAPEKVAVSETEVLKKLITGAIGTLPAVFKQEVGRFTGGKVEDPAESRVRLTNFSEEERGTLGLFVQPQPLSDAPKMEGESEIIVRHHFVGQILDSLRQLEVTCGTPRAARYAYDAIQWIRKMRQHTSFDPYVEVAMALHDAMAYENQWIDYSAEQYANACKLLEDLSNETLSSNRAERAIIKLEEYGFDTLPFEIDMEVPSEGSDPK